MPTVHFTGRVFPPVGLSMAGDTIQVGWSDPPSNLRITVRIQESAVEVECNLNRPFERTDFELMHLQAFKHARMFIDVVAFQRGIGLTLVLDTFIASDGKRTTIQAQDLRLAECCSITIGDVIEMMIYQPEIARALNVLTSTLDRPHVIEVNCALAIESVGHLVTPGETDRHKRWNSLRKNLNLTKNYLDFILDLSKKPRHGDLALAPSADQIESRRRAWTVMNRYFEFRKGGEAPLTIPRFPQL